MFVASKGLIDTIVELELELTQPQMAHKPMLQDEVGARALRMWSVSREEVWASAGVHDAWVSECVCEVDKGVLWSQRPSFCGSPPQGLCKAPHVSNMRWKQFMMCLEDTWFVAALLSYPMHDPGPEEFQRPARVCACKGAIVLLVPCLLSCCCWRRRPPAARRSRLRAAPPPGACR